MSHVVCLIQARLGSTRFPRKVLALLDGKPLIAHVVQRVRQIHGLDDVILAVPSGEVVQLAYCATVEGPHVPETDVLARFAYVARKYPADAYMRITADCPVLDPVVAGQVLELYHASPACDFASNDTIISGYPDGWDVEVFSRAALETAAAQATDPTDREHVTLWMRRPENGLRCRTLLAPAPWTGPKKLSVDVPSDLDAVKAFLEAEFKNVDIS